MPVTTPLQSKPACLSRENGNTLAFHHLPGRAPGVLFCTGFKSNMQGLKALALESWCRSTGRAYTRFDYSGHGESSGDFAAGTVGLWLEDSLAILDHVTAGPQVVVGSSMGGWIMLLLALRRPERIAGMVGVAAAVDFTERMTGRLNAAQLRELHSQNYCDIPNCYEDQEPYRIQRLLLEEGRNHLLLQRESIELDMPVRLIQGMRDPDVPWQHALQIAEKLTGSDVEIELIKHGEHRLSHPGDVQRLLRVLERLLEQLDSEAS